MFLIATGFLGFLISGVYFARHLHSYKHERFVFKEATTFAENEDVPDGHLLTAQKMAIHAAQEMSMIQLKLCVAGMMVYYTLFILSKGFATLGV